MNFSHEYDLRSWIDVQEEQTLRLVLAELHARVMGLEDQVKELQDKLA